MKQKQVAILFISLLYLQVASRNSYSQETPLYYRHVNYEQFINPAITGRDHYPTINLSHKNYWLGTSDSPNSTCIGASMRMGKFDFYTPTMMLNKTQILSKSRMGLGAFMMFENDGPLSYYTSVFSYSYFVPFSRYSISELSFGLSLQLSQYGINESMIHPYDPGDPELNDLNSSRPIPEAGFGIYYHNRQFQIGMSVNELLQYRLPYDEINYSNSARDIFIQTGYKFFLNHFDLEPMLFAGRINNKPIYYYNQLKLYYQNYNWIALAYKSTNSITVSAGIRAHKMTFAYAYEINVSKLQKYFGGSHEISLGLNVGLFEPEGIKKTVKVR
ncbi:MAG: PorP/SprF family type IX secretion system membrane protein [Bacteroidales bacterium]|nr:PorP/SprF family type IX secretion system membrane protein [Bacteroidales bacterium]MBN2820091.1 PorP/SprF family type IX secretion system membrane protein [Bacteroidales bacterium]